MNWTKGLPTEKGFYWAYDARKYTLTIWEVIQGNPIAVRWFGNECCIYEEDLADLLFLGPIPEPEVPK